MNLRRERGNNKMYNGWSSLCITWPTMLLPWCDMAKAGKEKNGIEIESYILWPRKGDGM